MGLSEIRVGQLDELVSRLLPTPGPEQPPPAPSVWRTSHISAHTFFQNKHGELLSQMSRKGYRHSSFNVFFHNTDKIKLISEMLLLSLSLLQFNVVICLYRVLTQKVGGFWLTDIPQTTPQSSKRCLHRATILAR